MASNTSWGNVASWYDELLKSEGTYQSDLILPNISRLLDIHAGERILDLACGVGFFVREYAKAEGSVIGVDVAPELIKIAKENSPKNIEFHVSSADNLKFIKSGTVDKVTIILAIQNIENIQEVFNECGRVLKENGKLLLVLNHPTFRIPRKSSWEFDEKRNVQYRRIDAYLSSSKESIAMEPGKINGRETLSFHRPLQVYFKSLVKSGFAVLRFEEWTSNKKSEDGPRKIAEDRARKEIPLFLMVEGVKIKT